MHVLLAGSSTRAAAASAARAGYLVTALDAFADLDQHPGVRALSIRRDFGQTASAGTMARVASGLTFDAAVYLSPFENHPGSVARLAHGRALWGNTPDTLRAVRDPLAVSDRLCERGCPVPAVRTAGGTSVQRAPASAQWLRKRLASGGGRHIERGSPTATLSDGYYLQEEIQGVSGSVTFVAAGGRWAILGVSRQLIGEPAFGAGEFQYSGNIVFRPGDETSGFGRLIDEQALRLVHAVADAFPLVGVNGIDFVARGEEILPVEINPRWTASLELLDRVHETPVFACHAQACSAGRVSVLPALAPRAPAMGKAVVYARTPARMPNTRSWLEDEDLADIPHPGELIDRGDPICTVFAAGDDAAACQARLAAKAAEVYRRLLPHTGG